MYNSYTASVEELITTRWHQCGTSSRGADCREAERGGGSDRPERAQAASQRPGWTLAGERQHDLHWAFSFVFFSSEWRYSLSSAPLGPHCWALERHPQEEYIERAAGRADECEAARSRGPGRPARDETEVGRDGDAGQSSSQLSDHIVFFVVCCIFTLFFCHNAIIHRKLKLNCGGSTLCLPQWLNSWRGSSKKTLCSL